MIDLSSTQDFAPFWTWVVFLLSFVVISGWVLWRYRQEVDSVQSSAFDFFKWMGGSLAGAALLGLLALVVEGSVWSSTVAVHKVLKDEVERVYGITFSPDSDFNLETAGIGEDASGEPVFVRYNPDTKTLETVSAWEPVPPK